MALAGSGRAQVMGNDAVNLNPAGLVWVKMYSMEASVRDDLRGSDTWMNASIVDSQAGPIAGGISYTYIDRVTGDGSKLQLGHQFDLALATKLTEYSALGITARYLKTDENDGDEESDYQLFTVDAGYQWRMNSGLSLGLTARNLTNTKYSSAPITWGGGLSYGANLFAISADARYNAQVKKVKYLAGLAYLMAQAFPLRAGASYDTLDESVFLTGGFGYQSQGFSADIAYRQRVRRGDQEIGGPQDRQLALSLRLSYF